jgi:AcrR family transcriptional regulator
MSFPPRHYSGTTIPYTERMPERDRENGGSGPGRDVRGEIVAAARRQFASGVHDVRMQDIARATGISRAYLYTFVSSREELIELAILARCEEFGDELEAEARTAGGDIAEELVALAVRAISMALGDPEFARLANALPRTRLAHLLNSAESPMHSILIRSYEPLLARALWERRLRTDVPLDRIYAWIQLLNGHLTSRQDLDDRGRRQLLEDFLLPSILVTPTR